MPSTLGIIASSIESQGATLVVTIDNTLGAAKVNWPVLVPFDASFPWGDVQVNGYDLRFSSSGDELPHWRESWDYETAASVWVKVPTIPANGSATISLTFGGPTVSVDPSSASAVFLIGADFRDYTKAFDELFGDVSDSPPYIGNRSAHATSPLIDKGGTGYRQAEVHEQSNIVWDAARSELVFLFTGLSAANVASVGLTTASEIGGTWTEYGEVFPLGEDPYIVVTSAGELYSDGDGWHYVYFERKPSQADVGVARSKNWRTDWQVWNGSSWTTTVANHAVVFARGTTGAWDETFTASPLVVHDGTQFVMLYEGASGTDYKTGAARSADGITWTKEATNPILVDDVVDDIRKLGSTWYLVLHGNAGDQYRFTTADAPADWDSSSFIADPATPFVAGGNSVNLAFGFEGADQWATYQNDPTTEGLYLHNWFGNSWRAGVPTGGDPRVSPIGFAATLDRFTMSPTLSQSSSAFLRSATAPLTSNFKVMARRRQLPRVDDQLTGIAIGSGDIVAQSGAGFHCCYSNGYLFQLTNPEQFIQIRKYTSGAYVDTTFTTSATTAEAQDWNTHECDVMADGTLRYRLAGTVRVSRTDSAHLAASKGVALTQGSQNTAGGTGATSEWEWIVARPFDDSDPVVVVGDLAVPVNTVAPAITGSAREGATLVASTGTWTSDLVISGYTYQWKRDGAPISGATSSSYLLVPDDEGAMITVTVTAANLAGSASATSSQVGPVAEWTPAALTNLVGWWDASDAATLTLSGSAVTAWADKSGNGKTLAQGTSANQPAVVTAAQNGRNTVRFTTNDLLTNASVTLTSHTLFVVMKATAAGVVVEHGVDSNSNPGFMFYSTTGSTVQVRRGSDRSAKNGPSSSWLTSPSAFAVVVHRYDGTHASHTLSKNGSALTLTDTVVGNPGSASTSASLNVGARSGVAFAFSGDIAEMLLMSAAASTDEVNRMLAYLNGRWAVY